MLNLLLPVDGSQSSCRAADHLVKKQGWYKEPLQIHLLNVQPPVLSGNVRMFISKDQINQFHHDEGMAALAAPRKILDEARLAYKHHILVGEAAETIVRFAREHDCQQIIMGTRGLGSVSGLLLGSVATKVIHLAEVPVLLVK